MNDTTPAAVAGQVERRVRRQAPTTGDWTMICNPCSGTGFKNLEQIPEAELGAMGDDLADAVPKWIAAQTEPHDVCVCDCCGDGEGWYGDPGQHYGRGDPMGREGPYANNGGLCKCH